MTNKSTIFYILVFQQGTKRTAESPVSLNINTEGSDDANSAL